MRAKMILTQNAKSQGLESRTVNTCQNLSTHLIGVQDDSEINITNRCLRLLQKEQLHSYEPFPGHHIVGLTLGSCSLDCPHYKSYSSFQYCQNPKRIEEYLQQHKQEIERLLKKD